MSRALKFLESFESFLSNPIQEELNKHLALLTEAELADADKEDDQDELKEAKSTYAKAGQIKSMIALKKKISADIKAKKVTLMSLRNEYAQAKDRKAKLAVTKKKKAKEAELAKLHDVFKRAQVQYTKLIADRKAYNKANRAKKKSQAK